MEVGVFQHERCDESECDSEGHRYAERQKEDAKSMEEGVKLDLGALEVAQSPRNEKSMNWNTKEAN